MIYIAVSCVSRQRKINRTEPECFGKQDIRVFGNTETVLTMRIILYNSVLMIKNILRTGSKFRRLQT